MEQQGRWEGWSGRPVTVHGGCSRGSCPSLHDCDEYRSDNENEEDDCRESAELRVYAGRLRRKWHFLREDVESLGLRLVLQDFFSSTSRRVVLLRCITSQALHTAGCRLLTVKSNESPRPRRHRRGSAPALHALSCLGASRTRRARSAARKKEEDHVLRVNTACKEDPPTASCRAPSCSLRGTTAQIGW